MSNESRNAVTGLELLLLLFIGLKLTGHTTWSWWWVMAPLWGIPAFLLVLAAVFGLIYVIIHLAEKALK